MTFAYRAGKAIEMDKRTLAKSKENGMGGIGHEILEYIDLSRIIIILSMCAWFILQTHFGSFLLVTTSRISPLNPIQVRRFCFFMCVFALFYKWILEANVPFKPLQKYHPWTLIQIKFSCSYTFIISVCPLYCLLYYV